MLFDLIEPLSLLIGLSIGFCCGFLYFNINKSSEFRLKKGKSENGGQTREEVCISVIIFLCQAQFFVRQRGISIMELFRQIGAILSHLKKINRPICQTIVPFLTP